MGRASKRAFFVAKQLAFKKRFRHAGTVDRNKRPIFASTGLVNGVGDQFLAGAGFPKQEDGGIRIGNTQDFLQHPDERRRTPDQTLRRRPATGLANDTHGFDEIGDLPGAIPNRRSLDIDMLLAARGVMQMQDTLRRAGLQTQLQRTRLTGLIAGHIKVMGNLVTAASGDAFPGTKLADIRCICRNDPVIGVHHDARLRQAIEE